MDSYINKNTIYQKVRRRVMKRRTFLILTALYISLLFFANNTLALDTITVEPSSSTIPTGRPKGFLAKGYDTGSPVVVNPTWSATGPGGTFTPAQGAFTIFTPTSTGFGTVTATEDPISNSAGITVQDITWNDFFHIFINEGSYGGISAYDSDGAGTDNTIAADIVKLENPPGTNNSPSVGTLTPANGNSDVDGACIIEAAYHDPDGSHELGYGDLQVRTQEDDQIRFWARYDTSDQLLYVSDGSGGWLGGYSPGETETISNGYAVLDCASTQVDTSSGDALSVTWAVSFGSSASGAAHDLLLRTRDLNISTEWVKKGTWAVKAQTGNNPPYNGLVVSPEGDAIGYAIVGQEIEMVATYHDADGFGEITKAHLEIRTSAETRFRAYYDEGNSSLYVRNSEDTAWIGEYSPGSNLVIENSYAKLKCLNMSVQNIAIDTIEVKWVIEFKEPASGKSHDIFISTISTEGPGEVQSEWGREGVLDVWLDNPVEAGYPAVKASCTVTNTGWAGVFFHEGELIVGTSEDLSDFNQGYLHFWVKTPVDLEVSVRSVNISPGDETSQLMLSQYGIPADNNWHRVYIALDDFRLRDERIDFARMKIFLNVAVVGPEVGSFNGTFFISDIKYVRYNDTTPDLTITLRKRIDNTEETGGQIGWESAQMSGGWEIADQYLEIAYDTPHPSWGAQIYTENMRPEADPRYEGDPEQFIDQQPRGLVGEIDSFMTCPMAWMVIEGTSPDVPVPVEVEDGSVIYFDSGWGENEWSYLKDRDSTKWIGDLNSNGAPNNEEPSLEHPDEIVSDFSSTGDKYSTFVNQIGIGTGRAGSDGTRIYILNPGSPIVLYLAADFGEATIVQKYRTNTLTVELYHD
jgi:hypothetical protein